MYNSLWKIYIWDLFRNIECNIVFQISESLMVLHTLIDDDIHDVDDDDVCEEAGDE